MAGQLPPSPTQLLNIFHAGFAAMSLLVLGYAVFMCASHTRKLRRWVACYDPAYYEPVIHLNNEMMLTTNDDEYGDDPSTMFSGEQRGVPVWQKNILMGGKCQLPDFSGVIIYDSEGNIVPPAKAPCPPITWK